MGIFDKAKDMAGDHQDTLSELADKVKDGDLGDLADKLPDGIDDKVEDAASKLPGGLGDKASDAVDAAFDQLPGQSD